MEKKKHEAREEKGFKNQHQRSCMCSRERRAKNLNVFSSSNALSKTYEWNGKFSERDGIKIGATTKTGFGEEIRRRRR